MRVILPSIPYEFAELEPAISRKALEIHYKGHLKDYVDRLNQIPEVAQSEKKTLEELILAGKHEQSDNRVDVLPPGKKSSILYNIAAQVYNHTFFFKSMSPKGGGRPTGDIAEIINAQYNDYANFRKRLISKGKNLFGSGWLWICLDDEGQLLILKGLDAELPFVYKGLSPLLCIDVWEHAYYLDYTNHREDYLKAVIDRVFNWKFANDNLSHIGK